jgi:hypothetical protein
MEAAKVMTNEEFESSLNKSKNSKSSSSWRNKFVTI